MATNSTLGVPNQHIIIPRIRSIDNQLRLVSRLLGLPQRVNLLVDLVHVMPLPFICLPNLALVGAMFAHPLVLLLPRFLTL